MRVAQQVRSALSMCMMQVFDHPAIARAKKSIDKRRNFVKRPKLFIQRQMATHVMCLAVSGAMQAES